MKDKFINDFHNYFTDEAYNYLGSHWNSEYTTFRVYAPHATEVSVVGDFNNWNQEKNKMKKVDDGGIFEIVIPGVNIFDNYKYAINNNGNIFLKQDPYGYHFETSGSTSTKVYNIDDYKWSDKEWMIERKEKNIYSLPINIYEVHLGSWKRKSNNVVYNYRNLADKLIPYLKKMGYNYLEVLPVMEYPFDGSWGYQVTGYFGITSRYGTPEDFMYLVNKAHENNIGVILDWVPAHFPKDDFGLVEFDGDYVYEDPAPTRMEHRTWGTRIFNFAKPEIKSFLISSANFYFEKYHIDGMRVDAVSAMIYLDYDREEWIPNAFGGNYNLEAIDFLRDLNINLFNKYGNILMIAEESTAFPKVTGRADEDGLGFNYKWNMGWMNDSLSYAKVNPLFKRYDHDKISFQLTYAFSENFILPISHDEVVHGKLSLLNKMPGTYEEKFANLRTFFGYMMTMPGKKLLFMGCEFGQFIEWNYKQELDWLLLKYPKHSEMQKYVADLNKIYLKNSQLYEIENSWNGFQWVEVNDKDANVFIYKRFNKKGQELLIFLNFSGRDIENYYVKTGNKSRYKEIFNSDEHIYGGSGIKNEIQKSQKGYIKISCAKFSIVIMKKL